MKRYLFLLILLIITIASCHHDSKKIQHKKHKKSLNKDTLFITKRSAVSVFMDSVTLEKTMKQYNKEDGETVADDESFYTFIADSVLESHRLPIINAQGYKYVKFIQTNRKITLIKTDTLVQIHTIYLFDPSKAPVNADMASMQEEYDQYFH